MPVLFKQLDKELPLTSQNLIKSILLGSLIDDFNNGQIQKIANFTQQYLITNEKLAHIVFTAIIKLAEDEMNHQKFNAEYIKNRHDEDDFQFFPNMQKHLSGVDYYFAENEEESGFESQREVIIQKYLYEEAGSLASNGSSSSRKISYRVPSFFWKGRFTNSFSFLRMA